MKLSEIRGRRILLMGLGKQGGGVAAANWLTNHGAHLTVTDLKPRRELENSVSQISGNVIFKLGGHDKIDFREADFIIINPDVPSDNKFVLYARRLGKPVLNEATLFYNLWHKKIIGITGTRGKTTTAHWTNHLMNAEFDSSMAGNSPDYPFLSVLDKQGDLDWAVTEIPSFHLELFDKSVRPPDIAVITNLYVDHLNRYNTISNYGEVKANLVRRMTEGKKLVLNFDNHWHNFFSKRAIGTDKYYVSLKLLPIKLNGIYVQNSWLCWRENKVVQKLLKMVGFQKKWGSHNIYNLAQAITGAYLAGVGWPKIIKKIGSLPNVPFRQETIYESRKLNIVNDTTATTPEATLAAVERFKGDSTILIAGGTDRKLAYHSKLAKQILACVKPNNIILLDGSATKKIKRSFGKSAKDIIACEYLDRCLELALDKARKMKRAVIIFSPGAKSFEKFENEYDRGRQFNKLVKEFIDK